MGVTTIENDGTAYATMANLFGKGLFGEALNNVFPPGYPIFVALFHFVIPDVEMAARLVSLVFGTLLIYLSFSFAKRVLKSGTKALWVAFLLAFHPFLVRYSGQVMSESLATFLFTSAVYSFYVGWQEDRRIPLWVSGVCLVLTYLTRPEYLIFYVPFLLLLLIKRRITDICIFLIPFVVLGVLYISYLHAETGLWIVSRKETLSPFVGLGAFFTNVPQVLYAFFIALSPLFFVFAILGYKRVEAPYRGLVVLLVLVHILSLSFISHATKRYSVELAPLSIIVSVEGVFLLGEYFGKFFQKRGVLLFTAVIVALVGIWQSYTPPRYDRALHKKAGLFLLHREPRSVVASTLPTAAFYANATSIRILREIGNDRSISHIERVLAERKVRYLVVDEELLSELPAVKDYLAGLKPLQEFRYRDDFVQVFAVGDAIGS
jgi:4-amino-4-deoxy-L-arabinose transferase-like glycosyltransferase